MDNLLEISEIGLLQNIPDEIIRLKKRNSELRLWLIISVVTLFTTIALIYIYKANSQNLANNGIREETK
jgi:hypothetical protein